MAKSDDAKREHTPRLQPRLQAQAPQQPQVQGRGTRMSTRCSPGVWQAWLLRPSDAARVDRNKAMQGLRNAGMSCPKIAADTRCASLGTVRRNSARATPEDKG